MGEIDLAEGPLYQSMSEFLGEPAYPVRTPLWLTIKEWEMLAEICEDWTVSEGFQTKNPSHQALAKRILAM